MILSEQPGRIFAIFVFSPYLIYKGYKIKDIFLIFSGIVFICYECFWVINYHPNQIII